MSGKSNGVKTKGSTKIERKEAMSWDGKSNGIKETKAFFRHVRVPEQCSGEMLIAELQRAFCFEDLDDAFIQNTGSHLLKELRKADDADSKWLSHFFEHVAKYPAKQAGKHDIAYVIPLIPSIAMFSTPRRITKRNAGDDNSADRSWKPGQFICEFLTYCVAQEEIEKLFAELKGAMQVREKDDELFAIFLDKKVVAALSTHIGVSINDKSLGDSLPVYKTCIMPQDIRDQVINAPFKRFAHDLRAVMAVKKHVSRRQFMAMLEAIVRIGTASHVLWTCSVYKKIEQRLTDIIHARAKVPCEREMVDMMNVAPTGLLTYGSNFLLKLREFFKDYELSSQRLNFLLHALKETGAFSEELLDWSDITRLINSLASVEKYALEHPDFAQACETDFSAYYRDSIKKFSLSVDSQSTHLQRFVITTLSQNSNPKEMRFARYDQSYFVRKRTHSARSASIVNAGAVALMTLVHCCSFKNGTILLSNLLDALQTYGIAIPSAGDAMNKFKKQLRELGLTIDSPDAESGMVLQDIVALEGRGADNV